MTRVALQALITCRGIRAALNYDLKLPIRPSFARAKLPSLEKYRVADTSNRKCMVGI